MSRGGRVRRVLRRFRGPVAELFPLIGGNSVETVECGIEFFATMRERIEQAVRSVDLQMYLWETDEIGLGFVRALAAAAERGVRVRVLADDWGARRMLRGPLREVARAGGDVRAFNPFRLPLGRRFYHRTHKKLLLVDHEIAYTGGAGFSLHFSGVKRKERPWEDRMFEIRGPVIHQLAEVFERDLARWWPIAGSVASPAADTVPEPEPAGTAVGRVLRGWPVARDFPLELLSAIDGARDRVWIGTPYFLPPHSLGRALRAAAERGVDVQFVLPSYEGASAVLWYASRRHYGRYLRRGAHVFERGPEFYHAKLAVVDRSAALFGSSNLDWWSWRQNAEIDLLFTDTGTVDHIADRFAYDRERSAEVTLEEHRNRGWLHRLGESFFGLFDEWL